MIKHVAIAKPTDSGIISDNDKRKSFVENESALKKMKRLKN